MKLEKQTLEGIRAQAIETMKFLILTNTLIDEQPPAIINHCSWCDGGCDGSCEGWCTCCTGTCEGGCGGSCGGGCVGSSESDL